MRRLAVVGTKTTILTERVSIKVSFKELYKKVTDIQKQYTTHKYYVYNDIFHWPRILASVPRYGPILHQDYSENMPKMHKIKTQSAHFNKHNYSLHCTVELVNHDEFPNLKSPYIYHYHLSDEIKHDAAFTSVILERCIQNRVPDIIRRKSDNCATQYKSKKVFEEYQKLAKKYKRSVIVYYDASGHGKGLVDAMGAFGVKTPLRKEVLTCDFKYRSSEDICTMLRSKFEDDKQKQYSVIDSQEILTLRQEMDNAVIIPGCMAFHMLCFKPDSSILAKK